MLKEFGSSVHTTWNLNRQCVKAFEVTDDALQRVLNILEMPGGRKKFLGPDPNRGSEL